MSRLKLSFLGAVQVTLDGEPVRKFRSVKAQALLAYLALESKQPHPRETLANLFWPQSDPSTARQNLRQTLRRLCLALKRAGSQTVPTPFLSTTRQAVQFDAGSDHWLDVVEFWACLEQGRWERAVELYRGHFLSGLYLADSPDFEQWAVVLREQLCSQAMHALAQLTHHYQALGDYERAQLYARQQLAWEPWREQAHRQLMSALAASGQRSAALVQYKICRHILVEQVGIEPAVETTALYTNIRDGCPLSEPSPHNSPASCAPSAHQTELAEIVAYLLQDPACWLLNLVGPAGSGKTCLAVQAAAELRGVFRDGVLFVSRPLVPALTQALSISCNDGGASHSQILGDLRHKCLLLVLDNLERDLLGSEWLVNVLQAAPQVKVLLTSRQPLGLPGAYMLQVGRFDDSSFLQLVPKVRAA
jgi:DNA-binding SARP family transcriptional activator